MKPLHITYLITDSGIAGAEKIVAALIRGLDRSRFEPSLVTLKPLGETGRQLAQAGIPVTSLGLPARFGLGYVFRLPGAVRKLCRELQHRQTDILHGFLFQANFLGRIAARLTGVQVNISSLRVQEPDRPFLFFLDRLTAAWVTHWTAVGEAVKNFTCIHLGLDPSRVTVIPNGVEMGDASSLAPARVRQEFRIAPAAPLLGTIGRLHPQKGVDVLLRALSALPREFPDLKTLIVGEGPARPELERLAAQLGVSQKVIFTGLRRDIPDILAALDLLVLPSRWEGMPNVVLEAMAAGTPVVATAVGAVPELVIDGETGLLVPPEDPAALAQCLRRLLSDAPLRARLAAAGRARVEKEFSLEKMLQRTQELYEYVWHLR